MSRKEGYSRKGFFGTINHYDSACFQKKKGHGRTPGKLPGCTYQLSRFSEGTFQNVL